MQFIWDERYRPSKNEFTTSAFIPLCICGHPSITHTVKGLIEMCNEKNTQLPVACKDCHKAAILSGYDKKVV